MQHPLMYTTQYLGLKILENFARSGSRQQKRTYPRRLRTISSHNRTPTTMASEEEAVAPADAAAASVGNDAAEEKEELKPMLRTEWVNGNCVAKLYPQGSLQAAAEISWRCSSKLEPETLAR